MEIIKPKQKDFWPKTISALKRRGVVVIPTDTAYGLAGNFFDSKVLKKLFLIKNRPKNKRVALVASSLKQVNKFFRLNTDELALAKKYWPGPLTIILPLKKNRKRIGVRVPKLKIAREICRRFGKPLTATSANISGGQECYDIQEVIKQFKNRRCPPDLIIDAGRLKKVKPSTLIILKKDKIKILREGPIKL